MGKHLDDVQKALILKDISNGLSQREIAAKREISKGTVQNIKKKADNELPLNRKYGTGTKEKVTSAIKTFIFSEYQKNHFITNKELKIKVFNLFNIELSIMTISRTLSNFGLVTKIATPKPLLRPQNIVKRFDLSEKFLGFSNETLNTIIFSDECKFNCYQSDGARYVRYFPGERYDMKNLTPTIKHGGGNVMVWGCISYQGVGRLVFIDEKMTGGHYKQI